MKVPPKGMVRYESSAKPPKTEPGRMTTLALGEEGGGTVTTQAVGEEGGSGGGHVTTMAVGEEGGGGAGGGGGTVTTMAVGEEGSTTPPKFTAKVNDLLSDKKINNEKNDYRAYGRTLPGHQAPLFGQQFKFGKAEAVKLSKAITANYEPAAQKKVLKEIYARSSTNLQAKGTVALTRDGAAELNKLAKKLGLDLKFTFNQPRPIHPVG